MKIIARIHSEFPTKFGIPHQSGVIDSLEARVVFEPEYRNPDALRGLEDFDYIWLLWEFSENADRGWTPTVRPPRLGGNRRMGVFATRSPFRPNPIGLSSVRLERIERDTPEGPVLIVRGADLMDGTPVYDIKPYIRNDIHENVRCGFTDQKEMPRLEVEIPDELSRLLPEDLRKSLADVLSRDPRPRYQNDPERIYGMAFGKYDIHFRVRDSVLTVTGIEI